MTSETRKQRISSTASASRELYHELKRFTDDRRLASMASRLCSLSTDVLICFATITGVGALYSVFLRYDGVLNKYAAAALLGPFLMLFAGSGSVLLFRLGRWIVTSRFDATTTGAGTRRLETNVALAIGDSSASVVLEEDSARLPINAGDR
jgi:hypothetical protein